MSSPYTEIVLTMIAEHLDAAKAHMAQARRNVEEAQAALDKWLSIAGPPPDLEEPRAEVTE